MAVRDARFVDVPPIAKLLEEAHQRSIYAETATFDPVAAKQLAARSLQRHGHQNYGGSLVLVSEQDGAVEGFLIGMLDSVYPCLQELVATDLLFIMSERAAPRDASAMLKRLIAWAEDNPKVIEVRLGVTGAIGDWERTAKLYRRIGLESYGAIFKRGFER